ncbi:MAG: acyl-CoA thioesterase [Planctomycetaceae bacterium]|nr:acyl-CoA thioesterase [Planctomycetaceae bacterium]
MTEPFITHRRVEFSDTDMAGIVHFARFYIYMESAEAEYFRSLGMTLANRVSHGPSYGWPRVSTSCNYKAPAYFEDQLEIRMWVERIGVKSLSLLFEFWRDEVHLATGKVKCAYCEFLPGEPIKSLEIPEKWVREFEKIQYPANNA